MAFGCSWLLPGCHLLMKGNADSAQPVADQLLKPIPTLKDGVRLDVFRVDRSIGDPRIGQGLWNAVSIGGSLDLDVQQKLSQQGFRIGTVPATPPMVVQELILARSGNATERTGHQSFDFPAGNHAALETMTLPDGQSVDISDPSGTRNLQLQSARCVLKVRPERIEKTWAKLECLPEIHHGDFRTRPVATEREWLMQQSQDVESLFDLRFTMELNRGEMAIIGLNDRATLPMGKLFLRNQIATPFDRVLIIRLADVFTVAADGGV